MGLLLCTWIQQVLTKSTAKGPLTLGNSIAIWGSQICCPFTFPFSLTIAKFREIYFGVFACAVVFVFVDSGAVLKSWKS